MRRITASDRSSLIRLSTELPAGSEERRAILSGLTKVGMEFDTKEALEKYLKDHPDADKGNHSVKKKEEKGREFYNLGDKITKKDPTLSVKKKRDGTLLFSGETGDSFSVVSDKISDHLKSEGFKVTRRDSNRVHLTKDGKDYTIQPGRASKQVFLVQMED